MSDHPDYYEDFTEDMVCPKCGATNYEQVGDVIETSGVALDFDKFECECQSCKTHFIKVLAFDSLDWEGNPDYFDFGIIPYSEETKHLFNGWEPPKKKRRTTKRPIINKTTKTGHKTVSRSGAKKLVKDKGEFDKFLNALKDKYRGEHLTFYYFTTSYPVIYYSVDSIEGNSYILTIDPFDNCVILSTLDDDGEMDTIDDAWFTSLADLPEAIMEVSRGWR